MLRLSCKVVAIALGYEDVNDHDSLRGDPVLALFSDQMFDRMPREFGTIDILVNNAVLQQDAPFEEMTPAQGDVPVDVEVGGQALLALSE